MANNKSKDLFVGALIGSLLGAATALLFAPKSGKELRADIADGASRVSETTQRVAGDVAEKSKQLVSNVSEKTQVAAQTIGKQTSEWAGKAKDAVLSVSQEVKSWGKEKGDAGTEEVKSAEASVAATTADKE